MEEYKGMEELLLVPKKELESDVRYYKDELTGNAWLNRAGQLAAKKKRILQDPTLSDEVKVARVKPVSHQLLRANKRLRQISPAGGGGGDVEDDGDDDLVSTGIEKWLKRLAKTVQTPRTPQPTTPRPRMTTVGTPTTSRTPDPRPRQLEEDLIRFDEEETPKKKKKKKTLTGSMIEGALQGLTGGKKGKKKATRPLAFTPPQTRSKTGGINRGQWLNFK